LKFTKIDQCALIFKNQLIYAQSLNSLIKQMFMEYDLKKLSKEVQKFLKSKVCQSCLQALIAVLSNEFKDKEIDNNNANQIIEIIKQKTGLVKINLYLPIRLAAIAKEHGPEMNKILSIVGKKQLLINAQKMIK
jgi:glutamyl/glutaminyl-tRNA synthetase